MSIQDICDKFAVKVIPNNNREAWAYSKGLRAATLAAAHHARHPPGRLSDEYAEQMREYAKSLERGDHLDQSALSRARETDEPRNREQPMEYGRGMVPDRPGWWWRVHDGRMVPTEVFIDEATGLLAFDQDTAVLAGDLGWLGPCLQLSMSVGEELRRPVPDVPEPSHKTLFELICEEMLADVDLARVEDSDRGCVDSMINAIATQLHRLYTCVFEDHAAPARARWFLDRMRARGIDVDGDAHG